MLLGHVDLIEKLLNYAPLEKWLVISVDIFITCAVWPLMKLDTLCVWFKIQVFCYQMLMCLKEAFEFFEATFTWLFFIMFKNQM